MGRRRKPDYAVAAREWINSHNEDPPGFYIKEVSPTIGEHYMHTFVNHNDINLREYVSSL